MTLVELMVVIGVIAVLLMLLLPAINAAVESGRRTKCATNQTRYALAMASYNTHHDSLPGWRNNLEIVGMPSTVSWFVAVLPFLERTDIYEGIIDGRVWSVNYNAAYSGENMPGLTYCPSRPTRWGYRNAHFHYRANGGNASAGIAAFNQNDGALGDNAARRYLSIDDISDADGLSTTLLVSEAMPEVYWPPQSLWAHLPGGGRVSGGTPGATWWKQANCWAVRLPAEITRLDYGLGFGLPSPAKVTATTKIINGGSGVAPGSVHPGGAVVAFADGSTRLLKDTLQPHVYGHLITSRSDWSQASQKYATNSTLANSYLLAPPAPRPYQLKLDDY